MTRPSTAKMIPVRGYDRLHVFEDHKDEIAAIAEKLIEKDLAYDPVYTIDTTKFNR